MRVRFRKPDSCTRGSSIIGESPDLTPGKSYVVFEIGIWRGHLGFCILDDISQRQGQHGVPIWYSAAYFDVVDSSVPDQWRLGIQKEVGAEVQTVLAYPEWAADDRYYERLIDREPEALKVFLHRKQFFDSE